MARLTSGSPDWSGAAGCVSPARPRSRGRGYPERVSFGLTFEKLFIIGIIAVIVLGPERLPYYASQLARLVRSMRDFANGAKERMREEMGPDFDEVDWKKLDPRQYDPRRIIREALIDDEPEPVVKPVTESAYAQRMRMQREGRPAPFDSEAT
jgi:sec-independent protein translocase protein TatB